MPEHAEPCAANGYRGARYLRDTPYESVTEWQQAILDAIPDDERCPICKGYGRTVILASNGGPDEFPVCWACEGSRRAPVHREEGKP